MNYRTCYKPGKDGKLDYSRPLYQFYKFCGCKYCQSRALRRLPSNIVLVTTDKKSDFPKVEEIIKNWECGSKSYEEHFYISLEEENVK